MLWWYCRLVYSMSLCSPVFSSWFFEVLGYSKASKPNIANGVLMAVVFFLVRIAVMPVYYSRMCSVYGTEAFYKISFGGRSAWIFSSICLDIMNIMWMHKIARGCYKVLRSRRKSKPESQENGKTNWVKRKGIRVLLTDMVVVLLTVFVGHYGVIMTLKTTPEQYFRVKTRKWQIEI